MNALHEAKIRAASAYNAAADHFDHPANTFWDRFGRATVDRLDLQTGSVVLDVCSGSGASAIPAAERVGPNGYVIGVDLAENLLQLADGKAKRLGLGNVEFRTGDMLSLGFADGHFDAVICVFGIFFVPDMSAAVRELWRMLRPGGKMAITTWGPNFFEPANSAFWRAIRKEAPELHKSFNPWDRISEPSGLRAMFQEAGIEDCEISAQAGTHPISSPEAWWMTLMGSGYRGTLDQLDATALVRVKELNLKFIRDSGLRAVEANVLYAVAIKPE
ncbi:MAG: methyltransferase, UbiE/COQ5 family [Proteobacteria bacterium]|nr:methyltransferase, UbiE/COQ5 family [Pseudomonadota bacterium]